MKRNRLTSVCFCFVLFCFLFVFCFFICLFVCLFVCLCRLYVRHLPTFFYIGSSFHLFLKIQKYIKVYLSIIAPSGLSSSPSGKCLSSKLYSTDLLQSSDCAGFKETQRMAATWTRDYPGNPWCGVATVSLLLWSAPQSLLRPLWRLSSFSPHSLIITDPLLTEDHIINDSQTTNRRQEDFLFPNNTTPPHLIHVSATWPWFNSWNFHLTFTSSVNFIRNVLSCLVKHCE